MKRVVGFFAAVSLLGTALVLAQDVGLFRETQKLFPSTPQDPHQFGASVALDRNTLIIGGPEHEFGSVGVLARDVDGLWIEQTELHQWDATRRQSFGQAATIQEDTVVIGAPLPAGGLRNSAYVFTRDLSGAWSPHEQLDAPDPPPPWGLGQHHFGASLALDGDTLVIGAPTDDIHLYGDDNASGAAYVFTRDASGSWTETQKLLIFLGFNSFPVTPQVARFGESLALERDTLVIGAPNDHIPLEGGSIGPQYGSTYVFQRDDAGTWTELQKLQASDKFEGAGFGRRVALDGDTLLVGADDSQLTGTVYVFARDPGGSWTERAKLLIPA